MLIDINILNDLLAKAEENIRLRQSYDLRTTVEDESQRMLNALLPGTEMPIHRHRNSSESVVLLKGHLTEIFYDDNGIEIERFDLNPMEGRYGLQVPRGMWHSLICHEPSVLFESKDGKYEPLDEIDLMKF